MINNSTGIESNLVSTQPNAWQVTHLVFLLLICFVGTIGNIMTIIAVKIERKLRESLSNIFVVNLAIADLVVCASVVPMLIAHDSRAETLFGPALCYVTVAVSGVACHTAAATMTCIALTRYIAASRATEYHSIVRRKRVYMAVAGVWTFAAINTAPILIAWLEAGYDVSKYVCVCFDGTFPLYYTLGPVFIGHFLPHAVTIYCYFCIVRAMRSSRKRITSSSASGASSTVEQSISGADTVTAKSKRKSVIISTTGSETDSDSTKGLSVSNWSKHERQLLKTSIWIIGFFSFCWIPYGILVLLQDYAPIELKKTFASLCLLSFSLNPAIYGFLSKSFRRAYGRIVRKVFCNFCNQRSGGMNSISSSGKTSNPSSKQVSSNIVMTRQDVMVVEQTKREYGRGDISINNES